MTYTPFLLGGLGLLGILLHNLVQLAKINKETEGNANLWKYWKLEQYSILIAVIMVGVAVIILEEIAQIEQFANWKGIGFIAIGYMGQSLLVFVMGKASQKIGKDDKPE